MAVDRDEGEAQATGWSDTWGCVVPSVVGAAIVVAFGIAVIVTAETDDRRSSGWVLVIVGPVTAIVTVAVVKWTRRAVDSGRIVVGPGGRPVVGSDGWDPAQGRRFLGLWYCGTLLAALGAVLSIWTSAGLVPLLLAVILYALARRAQRLALGLSYAEKLTLGPLSGHPLTTARRHEPGTWWARWAWADLALLIAAAVTFLVARSG